MTYNQTIKHFGSAANTAKALNIKPSSVSAWKANGKISQMSQYKIYYITNHALDVDCEYRAA